MRIVHLFERRSTLGWGTGSSSRLWRYSGTVKLFADKSFRAALGQNGWLWRHSQAAAGVSPGEVVPGGEFGYSSRVGWAVVSRCRRGRK